MASTEHLLSLLNQTSFSRADCELGLRGKALPAHLGNSTVRLSVVSGIRQHVAFATSDIVSDLCRIPGQEVFMRARNARLIMSDYVPSLEQMPNKDSYPYCIWYPDVASEDTYRRVAAAFPDMRYQVGRACAVAGYAKLYCELDLLPDPCIAEEAREAANEGSRNIFEHIMAMPTRYGVMNDYNLTIELKSPKPGACLNADTAVLATLRTRRKIADGLGIRPWRYFNITEDWGVGEEHIKPDKVKLSDAEVALLESPLPFDLPTMHKDLLILVAAYEGNVDRYARLRRPGRAVEYEFHCLVPGVYRSTSMALWLSRNPDIMHAIAGSWDDEEEPALRRAINARHVMNNDTHRLLDAKPPVPDDELPYWIWYPNMPSSATLYALAKARPAMRPQCVRASIAAGNRKLYSWLMDMDDEAPSDNVDHTSPVVDVCVIKEAEASPERDFFVADLKRRQRERGLVPFKRCYDEWKKEIPWKMGDIGSNLIMASLPDDGSCIVHADQDWGIWESLGAELGRVRLHLSTPLEERQRNSYKAVVRLLLDNSVSIEAKDSQYGQTLLLWASRNGHEAAVRLLLEKGANCNAKNEDGRTPLWWAARDGHEAIVRLLLENGADADAKDEDGRTSVWWAAPNRHGTIVRLLHMKSR
ncbi:ankyrin repeats (3 copies) domain-containing protein [Pochonia chlamydosporia 170]|uniref:Ankyrin repeats (3 copies) domain-containing protein n=1 Tax=Pochonia chlamydosporia 170 TaxID=1380566 RepID=A0A179FB82_METCM|nr:ankyrin repeats (3 copies) domain-containing protein [Pochonia chlamydosporia 170]OAQ62795.1 ankyrin repeats (3 copies) domain-containing protein [Pochonia chlamydosporia 170]